MTRTFLVIGFASLLIASGQGAVPDDAAPSAIETACIARLAEIANRPASEIKATGIAPDGAGKVVTLDLEGAENPWLCHVDAAGSVVDVMYQGEG